jgi:selenocysteine lyase/cysteine desulfurase
LSNQTCLPAKLASRQEIASFRLEDQNPNKLLQRRVRISWTTQNGMHLPTAPAFTAAQLQQFREDTPGTAHCNHLNNAGAALVPQTVLQTMQEYLNLEAKMGGYEAAALVDEERAAFYEAVAQLISAAPDEIAFAGSATQAYNLALSAIPFEQGDVIVTTDDDYVSNHIAFLQLQRTHQLRILRAENLPEGGVDPNSVQALVKTHRPKLVAVTHIPTNSGLVQDVESVGRICREHGIWYLVDACQSAGQWPLAVEAIGCDFLTATSRKFLRGPRGGGFLYASKRVTEAGLEPKFMDLHGARWQAVDQYEPREGAVRFETFECNYAVLLGMRAAVEYALGAGLPAIQRRVMHLAGQLRESLSQLGFRILDRGSTKAGIVTVDVPGWKPNALIAELRQRDIHASIASRYSALIDFEKKGVKWALRFSPHYYNTESEVEEAAKTLHELAQT